MKYQKYLIIWGIVAVIVAIFLFWFNYKPSKDLEVYFLDVGQGDSIFIQAPSGQNILIDGGPDFKVIRELDKAMPWWDRQIDLMILSHAHDDHVTGLISVLKRYQVEKIIYNGAIHTSPNFLAWLELVRENKTSMTIIDRPQKIVLDNNCWLDVFYPSKSLLGESVENLNNSSIVMKLIYKDVSFLFSGDAEVEVERELIESGQNLRAQVFKTGHHGSDTSNSLEFLERINPKIAVIQVGEDNDFGHPSRRVIKRLERLDTQILRNDLLGTIKIVCDEQTCHF